MLFTELAAAIQRLKTLLLLKQANKLIQDKHYIADKLKIERLLSEPLAIDQYYINLAIVKQFNLNASYLKKTKDTSLSLFFIFIQQKVKILNKTIQVKLSAIFDERKRSNS